MANESMPALPSGLANLLNPAAYPHSATRVDLVQTHISYVFLTDGDVYKVKKPVNLGFLDFTTLEARRIDCEREVRLNRRLCPRAYLGVVPLVEGAGGLVAGGPGDEGRALEWAVHMRRLPGDCFVDRRLVAGDLPADAPRRIAERLVRFHAEAPASDEIAAYGSAAAIEANWRENFEQVRPHIGRTIARDDFEELEAFVARVLRDDAWLFAERAAQGRCRDGHGDLRAESICLRDGDICIIDCIEFNDRFRYADVAADLAFLLMDIDRLGFPAVADELLGHYLARAFDETLPLLLPFYRCYFAFVRGKVRGFEANEPEVPEAQRAEAADAARAAFGLALRYARSHRQRPLVVTMCGTSGAGKSYVATALAGRLGAALLRSDVIRKELAGLPPDAPSRGEVDEGLYAPEHTARTFDEMFRRARRYLRQGHSVVLDAVFGSRALRDRARRLARQAHTGFTLVECVAPDAIIRQRLLERERREGEPSDATLAVVERLRGRFQPVDPKREGPYLRLDTSGSLAEMLRDVRAALPSLREG